MTLTSERLALTAAPAPPAAGELTLVPAAALCLLPINYAPVPWPAPPADPRSPRPHYIAAAIAAGVELVDLIVWLALRPITHEAAMVLLIIATVAGSTLVGAAGFITPGRPKEADR